MHLLLLTDRLRLRELTPDDLEQIHQLHSLPETDAYNTLGLPETIGTAEGILYDWLTQQQQKPRSSYIFVLERKTDLGFTGLIALHLAKEKYRSGEVWYKIHKDFWNKGYATEALLALLGFAFRELQLHRVEAGCAVENTASARVIEKVGMTLEGLQRQKLPIKGEWKDAYIYGLLAETFRNRAEGSRR